VKLVGKFLRVLVKRQRATKVQPLVENWYRHHAARVFSHRMAVLLDECPSLRNEKPLRTSMRHMRHRWGSCTKTGMVLLNPALIMTPIHCIDYVILHELCHLKVQNHSATFYRLLSRHMPDWEQRKRRLNEIALC
jgi:predicted metal-dependent hydrolase